MKIIPTQFEGLLVLEPPVFTDARGFFKETFNAIAFQKSELPFHFVQDNHSHSVKHVVRGLHFQKPPFSQKKLVWVIEGRVLDAALDLRKDQTTYGRVFSAELSADNHRQVLIPEGFAHGFAVLSNTAQVLYKCSEVYHPEAEMGILALDPGLAIDWRIPADKIILSPRDKAWATFSKKDSYF